MRRFFGEAADLAEQWGATTGVEVDATLRGMLERTLALSESAGGKEGRERR
jgi:hypothetical protein